MKFIAILLSLASSFAFAGHHHYSTTNECIERVTRACDVSHNDMKRIHANVEKCDQVVSTSGKTALELFLLRDADKLVVIKTRGNDVRGRACPVIKYSLGYPTRDFTVIDGNKVFIETTNGKLFVMMPDQQVYDLYNVADVKDVEASRSNKSAHVYRSWFQPELLIDGKKLQTMIQHESRRVQFVHTTTQRSLFRDE